LEKRPKENMVKKSNEPSICIKVKVIGPGVDRVWIRIARDCTVDSLKMKIKWKRNIDTRHFRIWSKMSGEWHHLDKDDIISEWYPKAKTGRFYTEITDEGVDAGWDPVWP